MKWVTCKKEKEKVRNLLLSMEAAIASGRGQADGRKELGRPSSSRLGGNRHRQQGHANLAHFFGQIFSPNYVEGISFNIVYKSDMCHFFFINI